MQGSFRIMAALRGRAPAYSVDKSRP